MKPANLLSQKPSRWIALIAIFAILAPTPAPAQSRHSAPEAVRAHVLKLGVGQWIRVREQGGVNLDGQITGIGPRVFQMQRRDAAGPTDVYYSDVVKIRCARVFVGTISWPEWRIQGGHDCALSACYGCLHWCPRLRENDLSCESMRPASHRAPPSSPGARGSVLSASPSGTVTLAKLSQSPPTRASNPPNLAFVNHKEFP